MYKNQAIKMFGGQIPLAQALGITSSAISQWPEVLDQAKTDRVVGAAIRLWNYESMTIEQLYLTTKTEIALQDAGCNDVAWLRQNWDRIHLVPGMGKRRLAELACQLAGAIVGWKIWMDA